MWQVSGTPFSSTNTTDHHDITEILLKVALNNITVTLNNLNYMLFYPTLWQVDVDVDESYVLQNT